MQLLDEQQLPDYLRRMAFIDQGEQVFVRALDGGVSNVVFYVERSAEAKARGQSDFVLKQARGQLRVAQPWFCSVERIWREAEVLQVCERTLTRSASEDDIPARRASEGGTLEGTLTDGSGSNRVSPSLARRASVLPHSSSLALRVSVPRVLFEDRENYAFAMAAAPPGHRTWKADLLGGQFDKNIASACGELLAKLHGGTWNDPALVVPLGDRSFFCDLRVDPYYRRIAEVHPDLRPAIDDLIASLDNHPRCLVHGDFSPKNLLMWDDGLMLVDCEVGHFGDPAFDLGFFLTHLVLKAVHHRPNFQPAIGLCDAFLNAYAHGLRPAISKEEFAALQRRGVQNLAGCMLARVDGKSPVEYLTRDEDRELVRRLARQLFTQRPTTLDAAIRSMARELG